MAKVIFSFDDKSARKLKNKKYILGAREQTWRNGKIRFTSPSWLHNIN